MYVIYIQTHTHTTLLVCLTTTRSTRTTSTTKITTTGIRYKVIGEKYIHINTHNYSPNFKVAVYDDGDGDELYISHVVI